MDNNNELQQRTNEWHKMRRYHIGSSDISVILGINPWKSAYELWLEKRGKKEIENPNEYMLRGIEMEKEARISYINKTGEIVLPSVHIYKEWPIAMASLDGINERGDLIVEIKCPSHKIIEMGKKGEIPDYYIAQIQWQLLVTEAKYADYFCYNNDDYCCLISVLPDKKYQQKLLKKAKEFWELIEKDIPPEIIEKDYIFIEDKDFIQLAKEYIEIDKKIKELEFSKENLKNQLVEFSDDGNIRGGGIKIRRNKLRKKIDWKKLAKDFNINDEEIERYSSFCIGSWSITIDEHKE